MATDVLGLFDFLLQSVTCDGQFGLPLLQLLELGVHVLALVLPLLKVSEEGRVSHEASLLPQPEVVRTKGVSGSLHARKMVTFLFKKEENY